MSDTVNTYNARVHMNSKVYYVTIPREVVRKMGLRRDDLVAVKVGRTQPPEGFRRPPVAGAARQLPSDDLAVGLERLEYAVHLPDRAGALYARLVEVACVHDLPDGARTMCGDVIQNLLLDFQREHIKRY